jgi:hypothetical protein
MFISFKVSGLSAARIRLNTHLALALHIEAFAEYDGKKTCGQLGMYPMEVHPDMTRIKKKLVERGRKLESLSGVAYRAYDGIAIDYATRPPTNRHVRQHLPL